MARDSGKMFDPDLFERFERVIRTTVNLYVPLTRPPVALRFDG
jgi:hypothetical protein